MTWSRQWWHSSLHSVLPAKANLQAKPDINRAGIQSFHNSEGCQDSQGHAWHYGTGLHNLLSDRDNRTIRTADSIQYGILQRNAGKAMCAVEDLTHGRTESLKQASTPEPRLLSHSTTAVSSPSGREAPAQPCGLCQPSGVSHGVVTRKHLALECFIHKDHMSKGMQTSQVR